MARGARLRRRRPRRDAPRDRRLRDVPPPARPRHLGADPDAHRPRLGRRPRRGPGRGCRRLPGQAVRLRRAARPPPCAVRRGGGRAAGRARGRRAAARPRDATSLAREERGQALGEGVRLARDVHAPARRSALAPVPARARLGLRVREPLEHHRRLHAPTSAEDRRGESLETVRGAGYRLRAET